MEQKHHKDIEPIYLLLCRNSSGGWGIHTSLGSAITWHTGLSVPSHKDAEGLAYVISRRMAQISESEKIELEKPSLILDGPGVPTIVHMMDLAEEDAYGCFQDDPDSEGINWPADLVMAEDGKLPLTLHQAIIVGDELNSDWIDEGIGQGESSLFSMEERAYLEEWRKQFREMGFVVTGIPTHMQIPVKLGATLSPVLPASSLDPVSSDQPPAD